MNAITSAKADSNGGGGLGACWLQLKARRDLPAPTRGFASKRGVDLFSKNRVELDAPQPQVIDQQRS
jgi:hypothetical protein